MRSEQVSLRHLTSGPGAVVALRELSGHDELRVDGVDTRSAVALLERLVAGTPQPEEVPRLAATDRDALLAALHRSCWGDRIVATLTCNACCARFDLSFELTAVQRHLGAGSAEWRAGEDGRVVGAGGASFTVPSGQDELDAAGAPSLAAAVTLLAHGCGADDTDIEIASTALASAAPIVDLELSARCAECGHEQNAHFDLQSFVLQRLLDERPALLAEVHLLATNYGWSMSEILALPRGTRRALAVLVSDAVSHTSRVRLGARS